MLCTGPVMPDFVDWTLLGYQSWQQHSVVVSYHMMLPATTCCWEQPPGVARNGNKIVFSVLATNLFPQCWQHNCLPNACNNVCWQQHRVTNAGNKTQFSQGWQQMCSASNTALAWLSSSWWRQHWGFVTSTTVLVANQELATTQKSSSTLGNNFTFRRVDLATLATPCHTVFLSVDRFELRGTHSFAKNEARASETIRSQGLDRNLPSYQALHKHFKSLKVFRKVFLSPQFLSDYKITQSTTLRESLVECSILFSDIS